MKKLFTRKRIIILLILIVCLGIFLVSRDKEEEGYQQPLEIDDSTLKQVSDICGGKKLFYLATKNDILVYDLDGKLKDSFHFKDSGISNVAYGDDLYALDWLNSRILVLDKKGNITDEMKLNLEMQNVYQLSAWKKTIYLSCAVLDGDKATDIIYQIDMETKKKKKVGEEHGRAFAVNADESYFLLKMETYSIGNWIGKNQKLTLQQEQGSRLL